MFTDLASGLLSCLFLAGVLIIGPIYVYTVVRLITLAVLRSIREAKRNDDEERKQEADDAGED